MQIATHMQHTLRTLLTHKLMFLQYFLCFAILNVLDCHRSLGNYVWAYDFLRLLSGLIFPVLCAFYWGTYRALKGNKTSIHESLDRLYEQGGAVIYLQLLLGIAPAIFCVLHGLLSGILTTFHVVHTQPFLIVYELAALGALTPLRVLLPLLIIIDPYTGIFAMSKRVFILLYRHCIEFSPGIALVIVPLFFRHLMAATSLRGGMQRACYIFGAPGCTITYGILLAILTLLSLIGYVYLAAVYTAHRTEETWPEHKESWSEAEY